MARLSENFHIESSVNARPGAKISPMSMRLNRLWGSVQNLKNKDGKKTENKKEGAAHLSSNKFSSVSLILYTRNIRARQIQRQTPALLCVCGKLMIMNAGADWLKGSYAFASSQERECSFWEASCKPNY